ncbi:alpha/beta hydrolase [Agrococcus carbonis]|uniref:Pimeloyl-ACP methyl ester carboxylesterase n=1 Tax=Agrococcus carbonis TaxID=684552 RepID=A0A1H1RXC3_9MICO|nr:alpha/beta fold hydrolase [Agrococcus carbonis]SDS40258.1 Pimeloyl-ACP methyl ester carboxylesterase [Agrococcus carbonis]
MTEHAAPAREAARAFVVAGGSLTGTVWGADAAGTPVVAIHGITANHRSFSSLASRLDARVLAVDLRGRGGSRDLPGPYGLAQHADDVADAMRAEGIASAIVVGHSMGAYVAVRLAAAHPELVRALVLVDGGLPLRPSPAGAELAPEDVLGPAIDRLRMTFESAEAYRDFWHQHPAFGPYWNPQIEEYVDYDLQRIDGQLRPSANPDAVVANLVELDGRDGYAAALESLTQPIELLRSPRGLFDEAPGLYDDEWLATWTSRLPALAVTDVEDTNHYTILLGRGVDAVADAAIRADAPPTDRAPEREAR